MNEKKIEIKTICCAGDFDPILIPNTMNFVVLFDSSRMDSIVKLAMMLKVQDKFRPWIQDWMNIRFEFLKLLKKHHERTAWPQIEIIEREPFALLFSPSTNRERNWIFMGDVRRAYNALLLINMQDCINGTSDHSGPWQPSYNSNWTKKICRKRKYEVSFRQIDWF